MHNQIIESIKENFDFQSPGQYLDFCQLSQEFQIQEELRKLNENQ